MARLRPGWLVVLCALVLAVSAWLPWLTSRADGGGHANAIGGIVGAMPVPPPGFGVGQLIILLASISDRIECNRDSDIRVSASAFLVAIS